MKRALLAIATVVAFAWSAWYIALPASVVEDAIEENLGSGDISADIIGLRKGAFMNFEADAVDIDVPGGGTVTVRDVSARVSPSSILRMKMGSKSYSADVTITGTRIERLGLIKSSGVAVRGVLDAELHVEGRSGNLKFSVSDMEIEARPPFGKTAGMFDTVQGALSFVDDEVDIESVSFKGDGVYARAKGVIKAGRADLKIEFMPDDESALEPALAAIIKRFMVSPGHYLVQVKTEIARLNGLGILKGI
jgi:hypothetical protein